MAHSGKTITFATDLLPQENNIYSLGNNDQRWKIYGEMQPIAIKTYTAALYNSSSGANYYQTFATVTPADYNAIWIAHYRITITASGHSDYTEICDVSISGRSNTYYSYKIYNSLVTYSIYQHVLLNGSSASYPHELGYRMASSYGATDVQKTVKVELLEQINCTITLLDNLKLYTSAVPTNYIAWRTFSASSNGLQETGDANDTAAYMYSNGFKGQVGSNKIYPYTLFARTGNGKYESFVLSNTTAVSKSVNTHGFLPDGKIYYNSGSGTYSEGTLNFNAYQQYHVVDYRYSFNIDSSTLPEYCETYLVWTYNTTDGLLYLDTMQWLATALPSDADGKIYQRIGSRYYTETTNWYQGSLLLDNPYYEYKNGAIHEWNGNAVHADTAPLSGISGANNLKAIEALTETSGLLKKTAANTWTLDTNSYVTSSGVTSITLKAGAGISLDTDNTAITSTGTRTISINGVNISSGSETTCLTAKGTWKAFNNYSHPTGDGNLHVPATGTGNNGKFLKAGNTAGSLSWATIGVADISWTGGANLKPTATANNQEWSIDLTPGTYTGTYWHVWSAKKSATIFACYPDDLHVTMPGNLTATSTTTGTLRVTGGAGFTGTVYAAGFNGPLTGNVTGDVTGNVSGNAGTVTTTADTSNTLYPLGVTNSATTTIKRDTGITMLNGTITATEFVGAIKSNKITPAISKTYSDTSFYGTSDAEATCSKFFISVKPDGWYKPWQVRFKVRTYAPAHVNADSVTWCTLNGRADGLIYANWNERYDVGHYYVVVRALKNAGFNAGLGHAVGVNIRYSTGRGNSEYYKTIELEYYDCSGCTVTVLDNAVLWANWTNGNDTNYNGYSNLDAINRGLRESGDDNDYTTIRSYYDRITAGTGGLMAYSLAMKDSSGKWQSFTTTSGTGTTKTKNTTGFILGEIVYLNMSGNVTNGNVVGWNVVSRYQSLINYQYSTNAGGTLTSNLMLYIVGSINANDGLFYLDDTWWTTTLPTTENGKIYIPIGIIYPDTAGSTYRCDFSGWHTPLQYINGKLRSYEMPSFNTTQTFYKGLEVKGHIAGDAGSTGHGLWSGGGYNNAYNSIILHGDNSTGSSGIAFVSDKVNNSTGVVTNINQPSDRAFIQYHACGVTAGAENSTVTAATSGEKGVLVVGVGNDATGTSEDKLWLQTNDHKTLIHQIAATSYVIPDTGNTSGDVGGTTTPVYVEAGVIKACTAYSSASVNYATSAGKATNDSDGNAINSTYLKLNGNNTMTGALVTSNRYWGTGPTRADGAIVFSQVYHAETTSGTYYRPWLSGCESVTDKGYGNAWTQGLYVEGANNTATNNVGYYFGTAWDANATTQYVWKYTRGGLSHFPGGIGVQNTVATTGIGLSLYGGATSGAPTYGIMFAGTGTFGTHGAVTSDWATYFTMSDTTNRGWIFRRGSTNVCSIDGTGKIYLGYAASTANPGIYWNPYVESASDSSDASAIYQIKAGVAGGTELRISQANDSTDVINIVSPYYIYMNSKRIFTISDNWFRINENSGFSSGVYFGSGTGGIVRTDNQFQVGDSGNKFYANSSGNGYFSNTLGVGGTNTNYKLYVNGTTDSTEYVVNAKVRLEWNATDLSLDFVFV